MDMNRFRKIVFGLLVLVAIIPLVVQSGLKTPPIVPTQYLAFQVFTSGNPTQPLSAPPPKAAIKQLVGDIIGEIGMTGDNRTKLAFVIGPLAFDYTDAQLRQIVQDSFDIALELNVAVGFHIDDSMFWARRSDLWHDPRNVEWLDWEGTPNTGRRIAWGPQPTKLAPQMCFNSPPIQTEVRRLATQVIGEAVAKGVRTLEVQGRPELFAGVIVGWETQIGEDFETNQRLGYCALSNRGFSRATPPQVLDTERERAVQSFIELWATGVTEAGIDPAKIYSHTAPASQTTFDQMKSPDLTYSQLNHFASPAVSFSKKYHPGFSTYPQPGLMGQLYGELQKHGNPAWASTEGSTVVPSALESTVKTETYLAWMFNHGAALVNIFGWGVGVKYENPFWKGADNPEAINAYRKFLRGQTLVEDMTDLSEAVSGSLPNKIHQIQAALPGWIQNHPDRQSQIEPLMPQLEQAVKEGRLEDAQKVADKILRLIGN